MPLPKTDEEKAVLISKIFQLFAERGFDGISMDEVANHIQISKATLYKYFGSKEGIVRDMVDELISHFDVVQFVTANSIDGTLESLSMGYFKAILAAASFHSKFLSDLENKFPAIYSDYLRSLESVQAGFIEFYNSACKEGFFKEVSIDMIVEQIRITLPALIHPDYLNRHQTSLPDAIKEYYRLLLCQLLHTNYMTVMDDDRNYLFVDHLVAVMKNKFLSQ